MTPDNSSRPPGSRVPWESTPQLESELPETPEANDPNVANSPDDGDQPVTITDVMEI